MVSGFTSFTAFTMIPMSSTDKGSRVLYPLDRWMTTTRVSFVTAWRMPSKS